MPGPWALQTDVRGMMDRQLRHMVRLIDDLLDVSRITRGKIELRRERIALRDAVMHAIEASRPHIEARGHELSVKVAEEPVYVDADLTRLSQVVANLLNNAARYTPPHGRIAVSLEQSGSHASISVKDTGEGIAPESLGKVFDLFTQSERGGGKAHGGLGIGLSIVKGLIELHGGSVEAASPGLGGGSEFTVRLPLAADLAAPAPAAYGRAPAASGRRVLVVDDNIDAAMSLAALLELSGSETRVAHDGEEALATAKRYRPDVILLDLGLPRMSGYDVCRAIRSGPGGDEPLIVALSGWGQEQDRIKSDHAGFDGHLVKPADFAQVTEVLQRAARS